MDELPRLRIWRLWIWMKPGDVMPLYGGGHGRLAEPIHDPHKYGGSLATESHPIPSHNLAPDSHNSNSRVIPSMLAIVSFVQILLCTFPCCQRRRMIALERRACKFGIVRLTFVLLGRLKKIWSNEVFELFLWRGWRLYVVDVKKRFVVCCNSGNLVWGELHCRKSPSKIY